MADQIINYDEEMVGANHPGKSDTLNRALLVAHDSEGNHSDFATPVAVGTANAAGSATTLARSDHVHQGCLIATGSYAGTDAQKSITGLGFQPRVVIVGSNSGSYGNCGAMKTADMATDYAFAMDAAAPLFWADDRDAIATLDADGFTVKTGTGNNHNMSKSGVAYYWVAWR